MVTHDETALESEIADTLRQMRPEGVEVKHTPIPRSRPLLAPRRQPPRKETQDVLLPVGAFRRILEGPQLCARACVRTKVRINAFEKIEIG